METVAQCDVLGWDYHMYREQPKWFIELLFRKKLADQKMQKS